MAAAFAKGVSLRKLVAPRWGWELSRLSSK